MRVALIWPNGFKVQNTIPYWAVALPK